MKVRPYQITDLPTLEGWWEHYNPEDKNAGLTIPKTGGVVSANNVLLAAGFVYLPVECGVCFIERLVAHPDLTNGKKREACTLLHHYLRNLAVMHGYSIVYAKVERAGMERELTRVGFEVFSRGATVMHKAI